ncbi:MAG: urate hydroxylase PuuD [Bacteriovoracaceae bacterium]|nr:urate hydroxylase PuuD [Bacteriovoracaceae bacterium]
MDQELFDWLLLIGRWVHITVAVTWIGTSIFFMWMDRTFKPNPNSTRPGHVGELWMVHGGGFYHVEKLLLGPTKVPDELHWFKWESYWTWMSGMFLVAMYFYTDGGGYLLDSSVSDITYGPAVALSLFSIFGSWFFYDFVWETELTKKNALIGHILTLAWFAGMSYVLCKFLNGRAAYIHIGGMLGTWMTANVFMRIIPRQLKMVEASAKGEPVNQDWGKNAKNRSTHNTYFTLPVIFIMLSNHFPATYDHPHNAFVLLCIALAGASIREYFVIRLQKPQRAIGMAIFGVAILIAMSWYTHT